MILDTALALLYQAQQMETATIGQYRVTGLIGCLVRVRISCAGQAEICRECGRSGTAEEYIARFVEHVAKAEVTASCATPNLTWNVVE
jgi:hypothetical protein